MEKVWRTYGEDLWSGATCPSGLKGQGQPMIRGWTNSFQSMLREAEILFF